MSQNGNSVVKEVGLFPLWFKRFLDKNSLSIIIGAPIKGKLWPGAIDPTIIEKVIEFPLLEQKTRMYFLQLPFTLESGIESRTANPEDDYLTGDCKEVVFALTNQVDEYKTTTQRWLLKMVGGGPDENGEYNSPIPVLQLLETQ